MKRPTPKVGDTLFSLNVGNAARNCPQKLTPVVVTKVGRQYFYAGREGAFSKIRKYRIDDWKQVSEYMADSKLYPTMEEWEDEMEKNRLYKEIRSVIERRKGRMALDDLKSIMQILHNHTEPLFP